MINAIVAVKLQSDHRHSYKIQKDRVIGSTANASVREVEVVDFCGIFGILSFADRPIFPGGVESFPRSRVVQRVTGINKHGSQRCDRAAIKVWAGSRRVYIEISDGLLAQIIYKLLAPFCRAGEPNFLSIPATKN